eukprot:TRINITY_DN22469_c0_g1_i2.p1 TRINITY_DN22469_c0_g1~~TRINITY_DN22469_c0_g1_i2.p1  ORF type:complete len:694 (+),score=130.83 TRINITY_DN22469_c0_g1_i2:200-2281(+)
MASDATDEELEKQAHEMAEKALPASLPAAAREKKLPAVKQKILERLKAQQAERASKAAAVSGAADPAAGGAAPLSAGLPSAASGLPVGPTAGAPAPPPTSPVVPPPPPPPSEDQAVRLIRIHKVEVCGDEPWFADADVRRRLRESVADAHKEQKILVAPPADEVERICPEDGRVLGAGAVLRLGGAHLGGYGESDIAYAYRQLSRALHPDKNHGLEKAPKAFHRLSEASDELRHGLNEQRTALKLLVAAMGGTATEVMLERPQEALFAEACRLLCAVCGIVCEGEVSHCAQTRAVMKFERSSRIFYSCHLQSLLSEWFERNQLLDLYASACLRTAYDCAPKCFRAQFLCLLNRAAIAEAKRNNDCVRGSWPNIMQAYPELMLWRSLREAIHSRVWDSSGEPLPELPDPATKTEPTKTRSQSRRRSRSRRRRDRSRSKQQRPRRDRRADGEIDDGRRHRDDSDLYQRDRTKSRHYPRGAVAERERKRDYAWESRWTSSDDPALGGAGAGGGGPPPPPLEEEPAEELPPTRDVREAVCVHPTLDLRACRWARKWRSTMMAVLPSGFDSALRLTDAEVRKLGFLLWEDIVAWASKAPDLERVLALFRADDQKETASTSRGIEPGLPTAQWSFVPVSDLFLVVGEGIVGMTTEGIFADKAKGAKRLSLKECCKKPLSQAADKKEEEARKRAPSKWDM